MPLELFSLPQSVVTEAEKATDDANLAAAVLGGQQAPSNPWSMHALSRLQSLSWRSADAFHRVLQPNKAADYGQAAANAARDQFEHTLVVQNLHMLLSIFSEFMDRI